MPDHAFRYPAGIMGTVCLPWTPRYELDRELFARAVDAVAREVDHVYLFGTAGEGYGVSHRQFASITAAFVEAAESAGVEPMVGIISLSLAEVLDRIELAAKLGVRRFQVSLPSWGACTKAEAFRFFEAACGGHPELSFMHYNVKRAGRLLDAAEYGRLTRSFDNLVAVKLAGVDGETAMAIQRAAPTLRLFLTEKAFAEACGLGVASGLLGSYSTLNWSQARRYYEAGERGDVETLAAMREEMSGILAVFREHMKGNAHIDGAFDQTFIKRHLPDFPLRLLPPYQAADEGAFENFMAAMRREYPSWVGEEALKAAASPKTRKHEQGVRPL